MFYTYAHSTPGGRVFYIGKGTGDRAYSKSDRSLKWRAVLEKERGYAVAILADWATEDEAYSHERLLISCFLAMSVELVNQTSGGKGPYDYCQSEESRRRRGELLRGYRHKLITCPNCSLTGGATTMKRWHFDKCRGLLRHKARTTVDGKRVYLGKFANKDEADAAVANFKARR